MINEYVYIEPLKKPAARACDGNCNGLLHSGFVVRIYTNKGEDLDRTLYYCKRCAKINYPYYFNKKGTNEENIANASS